MTCRQRCCVQPLRPDTVCLPGYFLLRWPQSHQELFTVSKEIVLCLGIQTLASPLHEARVIAVREVRECQLEHYLRDVADEMSVTCVLLVTSLRPKFGIESVS